MDKLKILLLIAAFVALILFSSIAVGRESNYIDPRIDWYPISEWELQVCKKWGGTQEAESGATVSKAVYLSQTTLSLQGRKQSYDIEGVNTTLYTASWYLEPVGEIEYRVELISDNDTFRLDEGTADYSSPAHGYYAEYHNKNFTGVKMTYGGEWVIVPLVELT